jgi:hypothetical protein
LGLVAGTDPGEPSAHQTPVNPISPEVGGRKSRRGASPTSGAFASCGMVAPVVEERRTGRLPAPATGSRRGREEPCGRGPTRGLRRSTWAGLNIAPTKERPRCPIARTAGRRCLRMRGSVHRARPPWATSTGRPCPAERRPDRRRPHGLPPRGTPWWPSSSPSSSRAWGSSTSA